MSIAQITRDSVLDAIRHGYASRWALAAHFSVLPTTGGALDRALAELTRKTDVQPAQVVEHSNGVLHVNDLFEQIPHDPEEGQ